MSGEERDLDDYRAYVGPGDQYDVIGAGQCALLYALGLRGHHRLLDIGCGSLRAGRMLIAYLDAGGYTGVEPNHWLVEEAIEDQLGRDILAVKRPRFEERDDLMLAGLGRFDFVLAHGVATNTGPAMLGAVLRAIRDTLTSDGLAAATFIHPGSGDREAVEISLDDHDAPPWRYPGCYAYAPSAIAEAVRAARLQGAPIDWYHPRHRWWLLARGEGRLPPVSVRAALTGVTLVEGFEASRPD